MLYGKGLYKIHQKPAGKRQDQYIKKSPDETVPVILQILKFINPHLNGKQIGQQNNSG